MNKNLTKFAKINMALNTSRSFFSIKINKVTTSTNKNLKINIKKYQQYINVRQFSNTKIRFEGNEEAKVEVVDEEKNSFQPNSVESVYNTIFKSKNLSPPEIVIELNRHIQGQEEAKKAVAIALSKKKKLFFFFSQQIFFYLLIFFFFFKGNRWRRKQLGDDLRDEVIPKNILMVGPTGCGEKKKKNL